MTNEQRLVLAHVVIDPDAWMAHAIDLFGEEQGNIALGLKVAKWQAEYDVESAKVGYRTAAERLADEEAAKPAFYNSPEQVAEREAVQMQADAKTGMKALPGWATWSAIEAEAWIQTKVTDLASAKVAMEAMAKAIMYLRDIIRATR